MRAWEKGGRVGARPTRTALPSMAGGGQVATVACACPGLVWCLPPSNMVFQKTFMALHPTHAAPCRPAQHRLVGLCDPAVGHAGACVACCSACAIALLSMLGACGASSKAKPHKLTQIPQLCFEPPQGFNMATLFSLLSAAIVLQPDTLQWTTNFGFTYGGAAFTGAPCGFVAMHTGGQTCPHGAAVHVSIIACSHLLSRS